MSLHNVAMNGGLLHSVEHHSDDEIARAIAGYRYFGLDDAASVIEWVQREAARVDVNVDLEAAERVEFEADSRYADVVADDDVLFRRFESRLADEPGAFAPLT